jgi:rSAM/selenodomain-associated transferase 1
MKRAGADQRFGDPTRTMSQAAAATPTARPSALVQVMAKAPVPGQVKTRLIPMMGVEHATELYCRLAHHTFATAALARIGPSEVWTTSPGETAFIQTCKRVLGLNIYPQVEGDLGARLSATAADGLQRAGAVIIVGTDCPSMTFDDLRCTRDALAAGCDAVLGPAEDGGYWLIGLRRVDDRLFQDIAWGTSTVLEATRERLRTLGWRWHELATRWDVDRPEDVARLAADPTLIHLTADLIAGAVPA